MIHTSDPKAANDKRYAAYVKPKPELIEPKSPTKKRGPPKGKSFPKKGSIGNIVMEMMK
jgi:hypothetical protein